MTEEKLMDNFLTEEQAVAESDTWLTQNIFHKIREEVYQRGTFTVYIVHAVATDKKYEREYEGVGFSKARPDITISQYDAEKGRKVARGRSIHDLFQEYKRSVEE